MHRQDFEGNWHMLKGKIQEKWGKFTHDDIAKINGKYDQFIGMLEKKYGYGREQAERELKNWQIGHIKGSSHEKMGMGGCESCEGKEKRRKAG